MSGLETSSTVDDVFAPKDLNLDFDFATYDALFHDERATEIAEWNERLATPAYDGERNQTPLVSETHEEAENLDSHAEIPRSRLKRIRDAIGRTATLTFWNTLNERTERQERRAEKRAAHLMRYADSEDDSRFERLYKKTRRNQAKILGTVAVAAGIAVEAGLLYTRMKGFEYHPYPLRFYEVDNTALSTNYIFGGRGDPSGQGVMDAKRSQGQVYPNTNYVAVNYPATIAPADWGSPSLDQSTDYGAQTAYQQYKASGAKDDVTIEGFSEGSVAALKFGQMVANDNGGVLPPNVHLVLDGSPVTSTGFYQSDVAQNNVAKPFLKAAGINPDTGPVPAGTVARYSQNDVWANSANQSLLGTAVMATDLQYAHVVQDPNVPHVTWVDSAGVIHEEYDVGVHPFTQQISAQMGSQPVYSGYNDFFQDIVPINSNVNGSVLSQPDAAKAQMDLATGIDQSTGGSGIPQQVAAAIPQQFTDLVQSGLNIANNDGDKLLDATQNPLNAPANIQSVMNDVNAFINNATQLIPSETNHPIEDFVRGAIHNVTGYDLPPAPVRTYIPPAPAPDFIPAPASAPAPIFPDFGNDSGPVRQMINQFLGNLRPTR